MNIDQLFYRISNLLGPETEEEKRQRERGGLVIKKFKGDDIDAFIEVAAMMRVADGCREKLTMNEEIPDDLTDDIFAEIKNMKDQYDSGNIQTLNAEALKKLKAYRDGQ